MSEAEENKGEILAEGLNPGLAGKEAAHHEDKTGKGEQENSKTEEGMPKFDEATLEKKKKKKCDEVFAEYLAAVAKVVKKSWYHEILMLVFLFRECLDHFGQRLKVSKQTQGVVPPEVLSDSKGEEDYCLTNNAEQAPEVSNEFVTMYLDEVKPGFDRQSSVDFTQNICSWLFNNGYTCARLSLITDSNP